MSGYFALSILAFVGAVLFLIMLEHNVKRNDERGAEHVITSMLFSLAFALAFFICGVIDLSLLGGVS